MFRAPPTVQPTQMAIAVVAIKGGHSSQHRSSVACIWPQKLAHRNARRRNLVASLHREGEKPLYEIVPREASSHKLRASSPQKLKVVVDTTSRVLMLVASAALVAVSLPGNLTAEALSVRDPWVRQHYLSDLVFVSGKKAEQAEVNHLTRTTFVRYRSSFGRCTASQFSLACLRKIESQRELCCMVLVPSATCLQCFR